MAACITCTKGSEGRHCCCHVRFSDLDGDEVGLALVCDGLGQQGLPTAGGTVEEHPFGRRHPKLEELLRVFHRVLSVCVVCVCVGECVCVCKGVWVGVNCLPAPAPATPF